MSRSLDDKDIAWLKEYETETLDHYRPRFAAYAGRLSDGSALLTRYSQAIRDVISQGRAQFRTVDEAHNEICVADAILSDASTASSKLLYEPSLPNTGKTIDFVLQESDGRWSLDRASANSLSGRSLITSGEKLYGSSVDRQSVPRHSWGCGLQVAVRF